MTRTEWEYGSIKLPTAAYGSIKHSVVRTFNLAALMDYSLACGAYKAVKKARKEATDKKKFNEFKWVSEHKKFGRIANKLAGEDPTKVYLPRKKQFKLISWRGSVDLDLGSVKISFDNDSRVVTYTVVPGNLACEEAHKLSCVKTLLDSLRLVTWTTNTGGIIYGNDEFNKKNTTFDKGADYEIERFVAESGGLF